MAADGATTPKPVVLTGSPYARYSSFYSTASAFLPMQSNLIDGVVKSLLYHWNVVYEIGNELRVPTPIAGNYGEDQLKAWIDWAAARVRASDAGHLITTSTGTGNESAINRLQRIQFCSFHQGQWKTNIERARTNAASYGDKHLVIDDDGGTRPITSVQAWSKAALNAGNGCRCSFNHKGISPINKYDPLWTTRPLPPPPPPAGTESQSGAALQALSEARSTSTSPCADE